MFLKVMHSHAVSPVDYENEHSIYGDVVSCSFSRMSDGRGMARLYVREPVKTAMVSGFCENEKLVDLAGPAYLMNEAGKTISAFNPSWGAEASRGGDESAPVRVG